jgi:hypothetical protein
VLGWIYWIAMQTGVPPKPAASVARLVPGFVPEFSAIAFAGAGRDHRLVLAGALAHRAPPRRALENAGAAGRRHRAVLDAAHDAVAAAHRLRAQLRAAGACGGGARRPAELRRRAGTEPAAHRGAAHHGNFNVQPLLLGTATAPGCW